MDGSEESEKPGTYTYRYPHPAVTVDCAVFALDGDKLKVLLIRRDREPYAGSWALPGGFVRSDEGLEAAARRELEEETGVKGLFVEQLGAFGEPGRDPRERVITVAWWAVVKLFEHEVRAASDAREAAWFDVDALPCLAFDHDDILRAALARLRDTARREPLALEFLPAKFTLTRLQRFYETVLGEPLDKRNFRKKALSWGLLEELTEREADVAHRSARLYAFDSGRCEAFLKMSGRFMI